MWSRGGRAEKTLGEGVRATDHSPSSDEPDACCYADHREGNGKRRQREKEREGREAKYGRQLELNPPLPGQGGRRASGRCDRSRMPRNASRRIREGGSLALSVGVQGTGIHLLHLLISDPSLSQHDSASFITFRERVCVCVYSWFV